MAEAELAYSVAPSAGHDLAGHYECAKRIPAILEALQQNKLTADAQPYKIKRLQSRVASLAELEAVHSSAHVATMKRKAAEDAPCVVADFEEPPDNTTYMSKSSFDDALQAAGSALAVVDAVMDGSDAKGPKGFAVIRPPGHHATRDFPMGFCLFNNVAIAARYCQHRHHLNKVMVLDFDVHHGNGTQDLFYEDDSVLFIDMHQNEVWPGSGHVNESGRGKGEGTTINVPMPVGSGHEAALKAFQRIVRPAAKRFAPDVILVSAGYDAHRLDPLEQLNYQSATYHVLVSSLMSLADELCNIRRIAGVSKLLSAELPWDGCHGHTNGLLLARDIYHVASRVQLCIDGRLVLLLEGGYSFQGLSEGVCNSFQALTGGQPLHEYDSNAPAEPGRAVDEVIEEVVALHKL